MGGDDRTRPERPGHTPDRALQDSYATAPVGGAPAPSVAASSPGTLPDRYVNPRELARGGMGRVVEAHDRILRRDVAIKLVLASDAEALQRFAREMRITARLEHPSIVPIHDAGVTSDGAPFYVMRKVGGRPLDQLIAGARTMRERLALVPHVQRAAVAVAHAHERGIIHRDLKPSNILVADHETVVIDWGLAKVIGEPDDVTATPEQDAGASLRTRAGTVFGTPGFMSPEQLQSSHVDARADVYALGATLYFLFVDEPPHVGRNGTEVMAAALATPAPPIAAKAPGIPRPLAAIIDRALAYEHASRYADAGVLAAALATYAAPRRRTFAYVGAGIAALVGISAAAVIAGRDDAPKQPPVTTSAADDLLFEKARLLAEKQPVAAIALLRPFAAGPRWRDVRAIAATAVNHGVPWRLGPPSTVTARSPDGTKLAAVTNDRLVIYDLVTRKSQALAVPDAVTTGLVFAGTDLIAYDALHLRRISLATGAVTDVTLPDLGGTFSVVPAASTLYLVGGDGSAWQVDARTPVKLAIDDRVATAAVSADGMVAFGGERSLWLQERGQLKRLGGNVRNVRRITWQDAKPARFIAMGDVWTYASVVGGAWEVTPQKVDGDSSIPLTKGGAAFDGHLAYTLDSVHGVRIAGRAVASTASADYDAPEPLFAFGGSVAVVMLDTIWLFDRDTHYELPRRKNCTYSGVAASTVLTATCVDGIFMWDLATVLPGGWRVKYSAVLAPTVGSTVAALGPTSIVNDVDVATGTFTLWEGRAPTHKTDYSRVRSVAPGGAFLIAQRSGQMYTLLRRTGTAKEYGPEAIQVDAVDDRQIAIATTTGALLLEDVATGATTTLYTHGRGLVWMSARPDWVAVASPDRTIVRQNLTTGVQTTTTAGDSPSKLAADGTIWWGDDRRLVRWRPDGVVETATTLPSEIGTVVPLDGHGVIVRLVAGSAYYVIDAKVIPIGDAPQTVHAVGDLAVLTYVDARGAATKAHMLDAVTGQAWPIAAADLTGTMRMTRDRRWLVGESVFNQIQVWPNDIPVTQDAMERWVTSLTNANYDAATDTISWP